MFLLLWIVVENKPHLLLMIWISAKFVKPGKIWFAIIACYLVQLITFRIVPRFYLTKLNWAIAHGRHQM